MKKFYKNKQWFESGDLDPTQNSLIVEDVRKRVTHIIAFP